MDGAITAGYTYNGNGQRVKKVVNGTTTIFHYNLAGQLIAESDSSGATTAEYVYLNGAPLAKIEGSNVYFYHNDNLGTPQKMTDSTGAVVWSADYKPFGESTVTVSTITNNLRFPGQYFDAETGLNYNYYRDYNASLDRFIQADPAGLTSSDRTLYVYARSNPLVYIDPRGLKCKLVSSVFIAKAVVSISGPMTQYSDWQFVSWAPVNVGCICTWKKTGVTKTTYNYADFYRDTYVCTNKCNKKSSYSVDRPTNPTSETVETPLPDDIRKNNWGIKYFNPRVRGESAGDVESGNDCTCRDYPPND